MTDTALTLADDNASPPAETPNTIHGRLLEAVHIAGYTATRAAQELDWLLDEGRWQQVGDGYSDFHQFLASIDLEQFKLATEKRKSLVRKMKALEAANRPIAKALGVGETTVRRDAAPLGASSSTSAAPKAPSARRSAPDGAASPVAADGAAVAKLAEKKTARVAKEAERESVREANRKQVMITPSLASLGERFATVLIDPPWDWGDEGDIDQFGRATPTYATMTFDELLELPVGDLAHDDAHIYLWITNRSLPKGFALLESWGFRYVTALTWVKPSIGMGNYFRGSTEHVLFGIRGSLPLLRNDVGTTFSAPRGPGHSAKPDEFYEIVETCSPAPWVELFSRRERSGWSAWGAEAAA